MIPARGTFNTSETCSESIGSKQFSGTGGQSDTAVGAQKSKNGRSVIALYSTAMVKNPVTGVGLLPLTYMAPLLGGFNHTHNQLLEILLHGGFVALGLYLGALYFASREALAHRRSAAVKTAALLMAVFAFMGVSEMFHNEPLYYALIVLLSRADCLAKGGKALPRISLKKRLMRDLKR